MKNYQELKLTRELNLTGVKIQMSIFYGILFFIVALMLIFRFRKENIIFLPLGIYFIIFAAWWIMDGVKPELKMFGGVTGWVIRGISAVALIICGIFYYKNQQRITAEENSEENRKKQSKDHSGEF